MPVTEFALLHLTTPSPLAISTLRAALGVQNQWHAKQYPHLPASYPGSICLQSLDDPTEILITARWESVAAHWAWINGPDNAAVMGSLGPFMSQESNEGDFSLLHVEGDLFEEGRGAALLESPVVGVHRVLVKGQRNEEEVSRLRGVFENPTGMVRAGWREDVEDGGKQEYVIVCGWQHEELGKGVDHAASAYIAMGGHPMGPDTTELKSKFYKRLL
ncbi:hypothetical protein QBC39DRAFT_360723 [Podospora conica]|nr:hypothetical protein QBC39DRAFT_360723 [Schizothecium conicum]